MPSSAMCKEGWAKMQHQNSEKRVWHINNGVTALNFSTLPRCQAIASSTGQPCKRPALKGQPLCGIHSGRYTPGAKKGNRNAVRHGLYTASAKADRSAARRTLYRVKSLTRALNESTKTLGSRGGLTFNHDLKEV